MIARLLRRLKQRLARPGAPGIQPLSAEDQRQADELRRRREAKRERRP